MSTPLSTVTLNTEMTDRKRVGTDRGPKDSDPAMGIGFPSRVSTLKTQIDQIVAEVQKQLPDIDFDSSDNQSDNEEPLFANQNRMDKSSAASSTLVSPDDPAATAEETLLSPDDPAATAEENLELDDLSALRSETSFPTEEAIDDWLIMAQMMESSATEVEMREAADLKRSWEIGHSEMTAVGTESFSVAQDASVEMESNVDDNCNSEIKDKNKAQFQKDTASDSVNDMPETVKRFQQRLRDGMKTLEMAKPQGQFPEGAQNKADDIMSTFMLQEPTMLSREHLDELEIDAPEASTLIQKLAEISIQSGGDGESLRAVDPHTGAVKNSSGSKTTKSKKKSSGSKATKSQLSDADCQTTGASSTSKGTSTASDKENVKSRNGTLKLEKRHTEPPTVDLRKHEHMEDKRGLKTVQRVLRLPPDQSKESSSSDDEEQQDWHLTRQKIKRNIDNSALRSFQGTDHAELIKQSFHAEPIEQRISLEELLKETVVQDESAREDVSSSTDITDIVEGAAQITLESTDIVEGAAQITPEEQAILTEFQAMAASVMEGKSLIRIRDQLPSYDRLWRFDARKMRLDDDKEIRDQQVREIIARRDREIKRRQDTRDKDLPRRENIRTLIEAGRSTGSTEGKQSAAEGTPSLFDFDVSFEEAPALLPRTLSADRELLLLTVNMVNNSRPYAFRNKPPPSTDTEDAPRAVYNALLTYFLNFVLKDCGKLLLPPQAASKNMAAFYVIGLQQLFIEGVLKLYVVLTPSETFEAHFNNFAGTDYFRKSQRRENGTSRTSRTSRTIRSRFNVYISQFLSMTPVNQGCPHVFAEYAERVRSIEPERCDEPYVYLYTPPKVISKPLATFVEVHSDPQAAQKIFGLALGFHWETVDNDEMSCSADSCVQDVTTVPENTMSVMLSEVYNQPEFMTMVFNAIDQENFDVAGVRLLYPTTPQMIMDKGQSLTRALNSVAPVLVLAVRGETAKSVWHHVTRPNDAGTNGIQYRKYLYSPNCVELSELELIRWFGGRVPWRSSTLHIGPPYQKKEEKARGKKENPKRKEEKGKRKEEEKAKQGKEEKAKGKKTKYDDTDLEMPIVRAPAALTATSRSDVFLIVSPLCPMSYFGIILLALQEKGFWMRGVKRLRLTHKMAGTLGIHEVGFFCPGVPCKDKSVKAIAPVTVMLLAGENAGLRLNNMMEIIMIMLTKAGLLGIVQKRVKGRLTTQHLFHGVLYSEANFNLFGRMSKVPEMHVKQLLDERTPEHSNKHMEHIAVVTVFGDFLKHCGYFVARLLNVVPAGSPSSNIDRCELLGLTCIPALTLQQAEILCPYHSDVDEWKPCVHYMESKPALLLVFRGVNIFAMFTPLIVELQQLLMKRAAGLDVNDKSLYRSDRPQVAMSANPKDSEMIVHMFFNVEELYPDPHVRRLLPLLPESRLYFNVTRRKVNGQKLKSYMLKDFDKLDVTKEDIPRALVGQPPILTVLIVKSRAVWDLGNILNGLVRNNKFCIVGLRFMVLSRNTANFFIPYAHKKERSRHEKHVEAFTCGPVVAIALQKPNAIGILSYLLGRHDPEHCRNPSFYRGVYTSDEFHNRFYNSVTYTEAVRDLKRLFPDGLCVTMEGVILESKEIPGRAIDSIIDIRPDARSITFTRGANEDAQSEEATVQGVDPQVETTCLLLCPRVLKLNDHSRKVAALDLIEMFPYLGLKFVGGRLVWLTDEQFDYLTTSVDYKGSKVSSYMTGQPLLVLAMEGRDAVLRFNHLFNRNADSENLFYFQEDEIARPQTIEEAHIMLKMFFDELLPGSHLTINCPRDDDEDESTDSAEYDGSDSDGSTLKAESDPMEGLEAECLGAEGGYDPLSDPVLRRPPSGYDPEKWTEL